MCGSGNEFLRSAPKSFFFPAREALIEFMIRLSLGAREIKIRRLAERWAATCGGWSA
jgi:hypothetical protein